jgi:hypothetical protein
MIHNATLLRIDPPPPGVQGPDLLVRCATSLASVKQQELSLSKSWGTVLLLYVPIGRLPAGVIPKADGFALVCPDGSPASTYQIVSAEVLAGPLGHWEIHLA